jgi:hypothetical protein
MQLEELLLHVERHLQIPDEPRAVIELEAVGRSRERRRHRIVLDGMLLIEVQDPLGSDPPEELLIHEQGSPRLAPDVGVQLLL